jgi:hypothetical protein
VTLDALDPGPDGDFPYLPRTPDGYLDTTLMPIGKRWQPGPGGQRVLVDVEPTVRLLDGTLVKVTAVCPPPPDTAA